MEENKRNIEEILKQINNKSANVPSKFRDSDVEFEIGKPEAGPEKTPFKEVVETNELNDSEAEETVASIFDIAEKEENSTIPDEVFRISTTSMPRFTEVSEKYSRLGYVPE